MKSYKTLTLFFVLFGLFCHNFVYARVVKPQPLPITPPSYVQTITRGQVVNFSLQADDNQYFKIWVPANASHLKVNYLHQEPLLFMHANGGSLPEFSNQGIDCQMPASTQEYIGVPLIVSTCNIEQPVSGQYYYIETFSEHKPSIGINQLYVTYVVDGMDRVAENVHVEANFIEWYSNNQMATSISRNNSSSSYDNNGPSAGYVNMMFDESLGRFEERPGGICDAGTAANPTYLRMEVFVSEPMETCYLRGSWDNQTNQCSQALVNILNNTQQSHVISTDEYKTIINGNQCSESIGNFHMEAGNPGVPNFHWFEFTAVIRGLHYPRRFTLRKVNGDY